MVLGKKGLSLIKLREAGFLVPSFVILNQAECSGSRLQKIIEEKFTFTNFFAVRSSFAGEDEINKSFAGYFYTALGVTPVDLEKECQKVISSYKEGQGEVILQEFINSDSAGVVFSNAGDNKIVINSTLGLCKPVVEGKPCDEFIIDKTSRKILSSKVAEQKETLYLRNNQLKSEITGDRSLSENKIQEIAERAMAIEKLFGTPQDIEFCYYNQQLFILQSRPITKLIFSNNEKVFYDNANIAESYSGTVLPLTSSFVKLIYSEVYKDLVHASGVSREKIERNSQFFKSLVADFYGKLYYNMNSWYRMMSFFPGYERNKKNFELMISSNIHDGVKKDIAPGLLFSLKYYLLIAWKLITFPATASYFKRWIKKQLGKYSKLPLAEMTLDQCESLFQEFLFRPLKRWYITVENDTALMTLLGKMHSKDKEVFNTVRITTHTVSANQVAALKTLSALLMADGHIALAIGEKCKEKFVAGLAKNKTLKIIYEKYFTTYGGRFANELKLESDDLHEDFGKFSLLVKTYSQIEFEAPINKRIHTKTNLMGRLICYFATNREEMRLLRSNMFSLVRKIFYRMGVIFSEQGYISRPKDIFYLTIDEIFNGEFVKKPSLKETIERRKKEYFDYNLINLPTHFSLGIGELPKFESTIHSDTKTLHGSTGSPGNVTGRVRVFNEFSIPEFIDFDILVTKHTDPGWVPLIGLSKGLIVEYGGILSHASIVARELGIPAVVGANGAADILKTGDTVEIDGRLGVITIKNNAA